MDRDREDQAECKHRGERSATAVLFVIALLALAAAPPAPVAAGATLRTSRQVVKLRVTNDGRELARLSVPERGRARVSREGGETLALTSEILGDRLKLVVSLQTAHGPNGPVFTPWETYRYTLAIGERAYGSHGPPLL